MNISSITKALNNGLTKVGKFARKYAPQILMGVSAAGVVTTTVLAVKATVKATRIVDDEKYNQAVDILPVKEVVALTWKEYIPTAISMTATVACGILSCTTSTRRNATLATLYSVSEMAREEYVEATKETVSKAKAEEIDVKAAEKSCSHDKYDATMPEETGRGNVLFKDYVTGRYFKHDPDKVETAAEKFKNYIHSVQYGSFNDWYDYLGLEDCGLGNVTGYHENGKPFEAWIQPGGMHPITKEPYLLLNYKNFPYYMFDVPSANI